MKKHHPPTTAALEWMKFGSDGQNGLVTNGNITGGSGQRARAGEDITNGNMFKT